MHHTLPAFQPALVLRRLGQDGLTLVSGAAVARAAEALHFPRRLPQHAGEPEQLRLARLDHHGEFVIPAEYMNGPADLARLIDYAAPDELAYLIPAHATPPVKADRLAPRTAPHNTALATRRTAEGGDA